MRLRVHYAWVVLAAATLVVFGALGLARFGYTMVLPAMQTGLGMDNTQAGALATANLTGYLVLSVLGGALAARFGPRRVSAGGLAVAAAGMLLTGRAETFGSAAVYRTLTGLGSGAANVAAMGMMAAWFARRRRGLAAGIAVTGSSLALIILGCFVPRMLAWRGAGAWRTCWIAFGLAAILLAVLAVVVLRNRPEDLRLRPSGASSNEPAANAGQDGLHWGRVYRAGGVWALGVTYVCFGFSYMIYMTFFVKYLTAEMNYTAVAAGRLFMLMGWCSLICGLVWGSVSDAIGRKAALAIVFFIHSAAFALFGLSSGPAGLVVSAVLFGVTAWSIPAIMAAACGDLLGPRLAPAGLGFITLFFGVGQALGPGLAGFMADTIGSFRPAFCLAAGVALAGAITSLLLIPVGSTNRPDVIK